MRIFADESVREWFMSPNEPQLLVHLSNSMKEYAASEPFIHNIYLISAKENKVWTLRESMFDYKHFFDQGLLQRKRKNLHCHIYGNGQCGQQNGFVSDRYSSA
jgi:hypothetical protein